MKISGMYELPVSSENNKIYDSNDRYKISFDPDYASCTTQARVVSVAINNHDALVELLTSLVESVEGANEMGDCALCGTFNDHSKGCDQVSAINLLKKIKGESDE